jgi:hypothetical protein
MHLPVYCGKKRLHALVLAFENRHRIGGVQPRLLLWQVLGCYTHVRVYILVAQQRLDEWLREGRGTKECESNGRLQ